MDENEELDSDVLEEADDAANIAENRLAGAEREEVVELDTGDDNLVADTQEVVEEEAEESPKEKQEQREQAVRVVVESKAPRKKKKDSYTGLTKEEREELKKLKAEESRLRLEERKLKLEQKKRNVSDARFAEEINYPERIGVYRRGRMLVNRVSPQPRRASTRSRGQVFTPTQMVGAQRRERAPALPSHPVVSSQSRHADYFSGSKLSKASKASNPIVRNQKLSKPGFKKPMAFKNPFSLKKSKSKSKLKLKRWSLW